MYYQKIPTAFQLRCGICLHVGFFCCDKCTVAFSVRFCMRVLLLPGYHWCAVEPCPCFHWGNLFQCLSPYILLRTLPIWAYLLSGVSCSAVVGCVLQGMCTAVVESCFQLGGICFQLGGIHSTCSSGTEFLISTPALAQGNSVPRVAFFFSSSFFPVMCK